MKITRRSPRIRIGNTTYTFGKNGVSRSTRIAKGVRIRTSASGKQSIGGSFLWWRWSQDLDELGSKKSPEKLKQIREQRKNDLTLGLLFTHPFVFFDHLLRRKSSSVPSTQGSLPQTQSSPVSRNNNPTQLQTQGQNEKYYSTDVSIFKETNAQLSKVSEGSTILTPDRLIVKANVTKEIFYKDVLDVYIEKGKIFISAKNRNIPLIIETKKIEIFMSELNRRITGDR